MQFNLIKCHGSGNDFIIIDEYHQDIAFTEEERALLAKGLCDRNRSLGADGILFFQKSKKADARMRVFNSDGSEASMCGNGLRCIARYAFETLHHDKLQIETMKTILTVEKVTSIFEDIPTFKVQISPVSFHVKDLPLQIEQDTLINSEIVELSDNLRFTALAVPNPHLVAIVTSEQLQSNLQLEIAQVVNGPNKLFPDGVNVSFVVPLEKGHIFVRTYERGVGFTNACGTAMSASTLVTCLQGYNDFEQDTHVYNPGGKVKCVVHKETNKYSIDLIGNATYLYKAEIEVEPTNAVDAIILQKEEFTRETEQYERLQMDVSEFLEGKVAL
ncbi:diaminopimelate epimerase [Peribacillus alkalitolerans]|uniref:diaminopimelate epimerase n=1 Tax=Peribacillus alkalitolerans TaxID=1550385 RepID=UPI0013D8476E|nr:diaminopimelate epimerase [Peribacillus alkalitolerans]